MTKQELIKILDEKIENAENHRERLNNEHCNNVMEMYEWQNNGRRKLDRINGEINAYTDIKILLENEVLENDK